MAKNTEKAFDIAIVGTTGILITVCAFLFRENVFVVIPLYVSLFVWFLQSKANKYAFLLGGINSILYAAVDYFNGLYALAIYDIVVSCSLQIITFINWSRHSYGKNSTIFKHLSPKQMIWTVSAGVAVWCGLFLILSIFQSGYLLFDNTLTLLGIASTVLCLLSYIEYTYLQRIIIIVNLVMFAMMFTEKPIMITHFIFNIYAFICSTRSHVKMKKLYSEQQSKKGGSKNVSFGK